LQCGTDRNYAHKAWRMWFTLFFIPVIPLKQLGDAVECESCGTSYKPEVLSMPTTAQLEDELSESFRAAVVTVVRAIRTPGAMSAAVAAMSTFAGTEWNAAELESDVEGLAVDDLSDRLARLGDSLSEQGKERFLALCTEVAATGGVIDADARAAINAIAGDLGMTAAHTRGVVDQVLEQAQA
jgi:hypothetical protein